MKIYDILFKFFDFYPDIKVSNKLILNVLKVLYKNKILVKKNMKEFKFLGMGAWGVAILLPNMKVLKLTFDDSEIVASEQIKGHTLANVSNVYEVYTMKVSSDKENILGIIIKEFVPYLIQKDDLHLKRLIRNIAACRHYDENLFPTNKLTKLIYKECVPFKKPEDIPIIKDIVAGTKQLLKFDIIFTDLHWENIGFSYKGDVVILDIGASGMSFSDLERGKEIRQLNPKRIKYNY